MNTITKIKLKNEAPIIAGTRSHPDGTTEDFIVNGFEPSVEIADAFNGLLGVLIEYCCLADEWRDSGRITGITIKHGDDGLGIVLTGQLKVHDSPAYVVVVNSPYLAPGRLDGNAGKALNNLINAAEEYIEQLPVQTSLLSGVQLCVDVAEV